MTIEKNKTEEFIRVIDKNIPDNLKQWIDNFEKEYGREPMIEEVYRLAPFNLGFVHYGGPPLSEKETKQKEKSISAQIHNKLRTVYGAEELLRLTCSTLTKSNRNETRTYVLTIIYLLVEQLEKDPRIFEALCEATYRFKEIDYNELLYGILKSHAPTGADIVKFCCNLLRSEDHTSRFIGESVLYCAMWAVDKYGLVHEALDACITAYKFELNNETRSPYVGEKDLYAFLVSAILKNHPEAAKKYDSKLIEDINKLHRGRISKAKKTGFSIPKRLKSRVYE